MIISHQTISRTLPPGTPKWVTPELLTETSEVWQPYYAKEVTEVEALEILLNISRLFDALENHVLSET